MIKKHFQLFVVSLFILSLMTLFGCMSGEVNDGQQNENGLSTEEENAKEEAKEGEQANAESTQGADYPTKAIELLIPFDPGGGSDVMARTMEEFLIDEFGVQFNFSYNAGAAGAVGMLTLSNQESDGYNIGTFNYPHIVLQPLAGTAEYDTFDSFDYIGQIAADYTILVVHADSPYETVEDLVNDALDRPGEVTISTPGLMESQHVAYRQFVNEAGIDAPIIPFQSGGEQISASLGQQVDAAMGTMGTYLGEVQSENLRALAITAPERSEELPDVPTFREEGYEVISHTGRLWMTPAGVDSNRLERLREGFQTIVENSDFQEKMQNQGYTVEWMGGEELEQYLRDFQAEAEVMIEDLQADLK